jgi:hypothetical protein
MAVKTITNGPLNDDTGTLINVQSPKPPFNKSSYQYVAHLVVDTDFPSGDSIVLAFSAVEDIEWANICEDDGTIITWTLADLTGGGKKLTLAGTHTADIHANVICKV